MLEDMDNDEECVEITILTPVDMSGMVGTSSPHTMSDLVAYIDGGSLGNPGPSGIGVVIDGSEAVEHCQFAMIQIRQPKHSATVIRLDCLFAHGDGLLCRRIGTTAQTIWAMQVPALGTGLEGFERYRLFIAVISAM